MFCGEKLILYHIFSETMQKKNIWSLFCVGKAVREGFLYWSNFQRVFLRWYSMVKKVLHKRRSKMVEEWVELHWPPPRTNMELQLICGEIMWNKQLNNNKRENLQQQTDRNSFNTMWLVGIVVGMWEGCLGADRGQLKCTRGCLKQPVGSPWEVWGLNPKLRPPAYITRAWKVYT